MGHRYEYDEVNLDILGLIETLSGDEPTGTRCTIYDEDTDEELASGVGNDEYEARQNAEDKL